MPLKPPTEYFAGLMLVRPGLKLGDSLHYIMNSSGRGKYMYLGPFEIFSWLVLISCIFCVVITHNISRWFFLAPAGVKNYNIVYTMYWLAAAGEIICILGLAKCYLDSYGANIAQFAQLYYGKYFWMLFFGPGQGQKL